jgi:anti-sigma B factor antagonist
MASEARIAMLSRAETTSSQQGSTPFGILVRKLDASTSVISVEGELDLSTVPKLKWMLVDALEADTTKLIVDLSLTTFVDSTTLSVLVGVTRTLDAGVRLAIVCARPNVLKVFEYAGLDGVFAIFPTLEEALAYVRKDEAWTN